MTRNERIHRVLRAAVNSCGQHPACCVVSSTYWYVAVRIHVVSVLLIVGPKCTLAASYTTHW